MLKKVVPYLVTAGVVLVTLAVAKMILPESLKTHVRL